MLSKEEYNERRLELMNKLGKSVLIVPSYPERIYSNDTDYKYRQTTDLLYYVGFPESNTTLVLENDGEKITSYLFVPPRDPDFEIWYGKRFGVEGAINNFGVDFSFESSKLKDELFPILKKYETVYYHIGDNSDTDELINKLLIKARQAKDKIGRGPINVIDSIPFIHQQRIKKSPFEIELIRKSAKISAEAHKKAMVITKPGLYEYNIEAELEYNFRKNGARGPAYSSIVVSGSDGVILHYIDNSKELKDGDLVLVDAGCEYQNYATDITRTWPINGKFTEAQKEVYQSVLNIQKECIKLIRPGIKFKELTDKAIRMTTTELVKLGILEGDIDNLIEEKKYQRFFYHGLGHWLGIDTHDTSYAYPTRDEIVLHEGYYFTVEPGIYIKEDDDIPDKYKGIAVRIEDDVLVTKDGYEVLTKDVPKEIEEIENLMNTKSRQQ